MFARNLHLSCLRLKARAPSNALRTLQFHATALPHALTPAQTAIVKSTAPVLAKHGVAITTHFYKRLLKNHPSLKNIFNSAHQATGAQPAALAHAVWAYASHIDNLGALSAAVSRIGNKHASLGVRPEQYAVVGEELLVSIKEVLGDAVTEDVMEAWRAAYEQLAGIFITFEGDLYKKAAEMPGRWNGWRKFVVKRKVLESDEIVSFHLAPADKGLLPTFAPGQYISVRCFVPELGVYQPRQYSLSDTPHGEHFRISVKREFATDTRPAGKISNVLHEHLPENAEVDVSMPYGDFTLDVNAKTPVVLMSGGVGLTPMMSMLHTVVANGKERPVVFVHAVRNRHVHAMKDHLNRVVSENPQVSKIVYYEEVGRDDVQGVDYDTVGRIDVRRISEKVVLPDADYYLCGPVPFMNAQRKALEEIGVHPERIHSEVFGSAA
ncbi:flavodoxin reductases (ferredoxin-NADPH reductases) family 1, partial [Fimicolochytrium jonesii]|uniref:flavodoxin reductases (ferredoxin-NADPH reductases) family 1 n=1 Tax=Fimicolochytrium jonesii TaxID=1396493 RepID=UPI0022FE6ACC